MDISSLIIILYENYSATIEMINATQLSDESASYPTTTEGLPGGEIHFNCTVTIGTRTIINPSIQSFFGLGLVSR